MPGVVSRSKGRGPPSTCRTTGPPCRRRRRLAGSSIAASARTHAVGRRRSPVGIGRSGRWRSRHAGSLAAFLTDRLGLYAVDGAGRLSWTAIRHAAWPLQPAEAEIERNTMAAAHGIALPADAPLLHFAKRLDVVAWWPRRIADWPADLNGPYGQATLSISSGWMARIWIPYRTPPSSTRWSMGREFAKRATDAASSPSRRTQRSQTGCSMACPAVARSIGGDHPTIVASRSPGSSVLHHMRRAGGVQRSRPPIARMCR